MAEMVEPPSLATIPQWAMRKALLLGRLVLLGVSAVEPQEALRWVVLLMPTQDGLVAAVRASYYKERQSLASQIQLHQEEAQLGSMALAAEEAARQVQKEIALGPLLQSVARGAMEAPMLAAAEEAAVQHWFNLLTWELGTLQM